MAFAIQNILQLVLRLIAYIEEGHPALAICLLGAVITGVVIISKAMSANPADPEL